jgi:polysaccharide export outer membrane protein
MMVAAGLVAAPFLGGCSLDSDSFLLDPSVLGRWERTPATVPILPRIASIEGPEDEFVQYTDPTPADLIPEVTEYRIGPGDRLDITLFDLPEDNRATPYQGKIVDARGYIELPQLGSINVNGLTVSEATAAIQNAMKPLVTTPLASVEVVQPRQQRFNIVGDVRAPGPFFIPVADYRLLEALAAAGGYSESSEVLYVIRQAPLTEQAGGRTPQAKPPEGTAPTPKSGENINDLIREMTKPNQPPAPPPPPGQTGQTGQTGPSGSPGVFQPGTQPQAPAKPPIDLIPSGAPGAPPAAEQPAQPEPDTGQYSWMMLNGKWVKVKRPQAAAPETPMPGGLPAPTAQAPLLTQRVIRIPLHRLSNGDARVNIVVRPGDVIRVPPQPSGTIFIGGQTNRPGAFGMTNQLTLTNAITAAGGLLQNAVPERVDLRRQIGHDRVAIIMLNLRSIAEGTEPDIYLKPNDSIIVGSNFWSTPLAVIRNGFRMTYGFGLLADRNFGSDIFGVPPESRARGF